MTKFEKHILTECYERGQHLSQRYNSGKDINNKQVPGKPKGKCIFFR